MRQRRIVLTGGPGAGKTAVLELARRAVCDHVAFVHEAASIVFGGGFPRERSEAALCAEQRAIFHVQHELETIAASHEHATIALCDRGTIDGLAYWPKEARDFFAEVGSSYEAELARYDVVIHLRTPAAEAGYHASALRIETAAEAARIDARIENAWRMHPRRIFVASTHDFIEKVGVAIAHIRNELPEPCRRAHALRETAPLAALPSQPKPDLPA